MLEHIGGFLFQNDQYEEAIQLAERRLEPISISEGYQQLGELSALQNDWDRCEAAFSRAVEVLDMAGLEDARDNALARHRQLLGDRVFDHASGEKRRPAYFPGCRRSATTISAAPESGWRKRGAARRRSHRP